MPRGKGDKSNKTDEGPLNEVKKKGGKRKKADGNTKVENKQPKKVKKTPTEDKDLEKEEPRQNAKSDEKKKKKSNEAKKSESNNSNEVLKQEQVKEKKKKNQKIGKVVRDKNGKPISEKSLEYFDEIYSRSIGNVLSSIESGKQRELTRKIMLSMKSRVMEELNLARIGPEHYLLLEYEKTHEESQKAFARCVVLKERLDDLEKNRKQNELEIEQKEKKKQFKRKWRN